MIVSPSPRAREIARIVEIYRVSYSTAARWIDSGRLGECIARHEAKQAPQNLCSARAGRSGNKVNRWQDYESRKRDLAATAQSSAEYEQRLQALAEEMGV